MMERCTRAGLTLRGTAAALRGGASLHAIAVWSCACALLLLAACDELNDTPRSRAGERDAGSRGGKRGDAGGDAAVRPALGLADDSAGAACALDAECAGGRCEPLAAGPQRDASTDDSGYCTGACTSNAQCGRGGLCVAIPERPDAGLCLSACARQSECREGFLCIGAASAPAFSLLGTCRPKRPAGMLGDGVAGQACTGDGDCEGGRCADTNPLGTSYPGNYCTGRCYEDRDCGAGGTCLLLSSSPDPGHCLQSCESDPDCGRDHYRCRELGTGERVLHACLPGAAPLPDGTAGKPCSTDDDCGGQVDTCAQQLPFAGVSDGALLSAPAGYCTQECTHDSDCGQNAQCISRGPTGGICFASCNDDTAPCRDGYYCLAHLRDGDPNARICVPNPPTADAGL